MQERQTQTALDNRQAVLRLVTDVTAVPLADDVVLQDFAQSITIAGRRAVTDFICAFFCRAFAEMTLEINTLLADGETATLSLVLAGRHIAPFWGMPCTGRHVTLSLALICRFHAGQIVYIEWYYDGGTLLRQLGLAL
ncbi:MAG: ester cyclase [Ardenticatenaceae bacterium]|nr:ester cyclase [Ardenticatenaceae bacterium]MCB9442590.1 ester cyclase [Ardenticatenaceae bacterium]